VKIDILPRSEIGRISLAQWQQLSKESVFINPFYEPWCLLPAVRYLELHKKVFIVTAYERDRLVALFPVVLKRAPLSIRHLAIWKHSHCFLSDPLCLEESHLPPMIDAVTQRLSATLFQIKDHSPFPNSFYSRRVGFFITSTRGAIFNAENVQQHFDAQPRKRRAENGRVIRRLIDSGDVTYVTSRDISDIDWLETYCALEHAGWKGRAKGSIFSSRGTSRYYREVDAEGRKLGLMEFQGIFEGSSPLAVSFRIVSRGCAFELKTTYNENFKQCYPGVVLELLNMDALGKSNFTMVDSCTSSNNSLVNRIWPDRREICNSFYFSNGHFGRLAKSVLEAAFRLRTRFSANS
jgi:CelD/BcsL family acetyltransferase involved in cellulose biosynthesis